MRILSSEIRMLNGNEGLGTAAGNKAIECQLSYFASAKLPFRIVPTSCRSQCANIRPCGKFGRVHFSRLRMHPTIIPAGSITPDATIWLFEIQWVTNDCMLSVEGRRGDMTETTFTFRLDRALKAAFTAIADEQDLSAAQLLRRMMRDAVEDHQEASAHERWQQREIGDAMREANVTGGMNVPNQAIKDDWQRRKDEIDRDPA